MGCTWLVEEDPPEMRKGTAPTVPFAYSQTLQLGLDSAETEEAQRFFDCLTRAVERFQQQQRRDAKAIKQLARALRSGTETHV